MEHVSVHAYDWTVEDAATEEGHLVIRAWCLNRDSEPVLVRIEDFPAFCYVELPLYVKMHPYSWDSHKANRFFQEIQKLLGNRRAERMTFKRLKRTYYYRGDRTYPMLMLTFPTLNAMHHCAHILNEVIKTEEWGTVKCNVWESEISVHRKLLTVRNIRYGQWFYFSASRVPEEHRTSTLEREYVVSYNQLDPIPLAMTAGWITKPRMLAFDIECYSSNHRGFPDRYNSLHDVFMISCIYQRLGHPETRKRYGIIYGDCDAIPESRLQNLQIIKVGSEKELVDQFGEIVRTQDPEIVSGFNISNFDIPYLDARLKRFLHKWPIMGRLLGRPSVTTTTTWKSGGYGHNSVTLLKMEGRINMDLYSIVRRGQRRLDMYNLDTVCRVFLGKGKHDVKHITIFQVYEGMKKTLDALHEYLSSCVDATNPDFPEAEILSMEGVREFLARRWMGPSLWSNLEITNIQQLRELRDDLKVWRKKMAEVMEYCIRDSELVIDLAEELNVWIGHVEMSSVVGTTIVDLYTRGQQIRCHSLLYNLAAREGYVLDRRVSSGCKFTGGHVEEPIIGVHDNIVCLDFASLYPSIIQAFNICFTTLIPHVNETENDIPDEDCHIIEFDQEEPLVQREQEKRFLTEEGENPDDEDEEDVLDEEQENPGTKTVTRHYRFRWYRKKEGLLPRLVRELVAERRAAIKERDAAKKRGETMTVLILEERQLALKVTANSFFGFLGIRNGGKMSLLEGAMSITAKGRELLGLVKKYLHEKYNARVVYGDTDSVMVDLGLKDSKLCHEWGVRLSREISGVPEHKDEKTGEIILAVPGLFHTFVLQIAFEKAMRIVNLAKKKYAALYITKDGSFKMKDVKNESGQVVGQELDILRKGLVVARRDNCRWVYDTYNKILELVLLRRPFEEAMDVLIDAVDSLLKGQVPYKKLVIVRGLGDNYKNHNYFLKVFADNLNREGKEVRPGDRLPFLVVKTENDKALLGHRMRLLDSWLEKEEDEREPIDYNYYIEHMLQNHISQLLSVGYQETIAKLPHFGVKPSGRHKFIGLNEPVKLLITMNRLGFPILPLKEAIRANLRVKEEEEKRPPPKVQLVIEKPRRPTLIIEKPRRPTLIIEEPPHPFPFENPSQTRPPPPSLWIVCSSTPPPSIGRSG